jgi:hypothetical protein
VTVSMTSFTGERSRVLRSPVLLACVLIASALVGCKSTSDEPVLGEGVVVERAEEDAEAEARRETIEERLREVEILLVREQLEKALAIVDELLEEDLPLDLLGRCRGSVSTSDGASTPSVLSGGGSGRTAISTRSATASS